MEPHRPTPSPPRRIRSLGRQLFGILLAAGCLWLAFRGIDTSALLRALAGASFVCILASGLLHLIGACVKCTKIGILVRPVKKLTYRNLFAAEMVSVLVDTLFPLRLHELVRAYFLGRSGKISSAFIFGTEFVVKVVEVLLLTAALFALSALTPMPPWATTSIHLLLAIVWAAGSFLIIMVRWPALGRLPHRLLERVNIRGVSRIGRLLTEVLDGISRTAVRPSALLGVLLVTVTEWTLLSGGLWMAALAVGVTLTPVQLLGVLVANHVAFAIPSSTSGSIGIYEATGTMTLVHLFNMQQEEALAVVLVAHGIMFCVAMLGGGLGLKLAHVSLREVRTQSQDAT
jgi:glycosyltransferase 2 family protein